MPLLRADRMTTGLIVSGAGHAALIAWVLFGGLFARTPLPEPQAASVALISEEEFAALTRPRVAPDIMQEMPPAEPAPQAESTPSAPPADDGVATPDAPTAAGPDRPDAVPQVPARPEAPEAEVADAAPEAPAPPPVEAPDRPSAPRAVPRPADRVARQSVPPPPPQAEIGPDRVPTRAPDPLPQSEPVEEERPQAPQEAAPVIVTEADEPAAPPDQLDAAGEVVAARGRAPLASPRPLGRPVVSARADPGPSAGAPRTPGSSSTASSAAVGERQDEIMAALEQALSEPEAAPEQGAPAGPPLTRGERDGLRLAVQECWSVDTGSEAASVTVTVGFELDRSGRVVGSDVRRIGAQGGSEASQRAAFDRARRAVLQCQNRGRDGYALPPEKYEQWRTVEVTFDPSNMRLR